MNEKPAGAAAKQCGHMDQHPQNDWGSVSYDGRFGEYWVPAGSARQMLFYCPWCGEKLPNSKRDEWFDAIEALGLDPWNDDVPTEYQSDAWWNNVSRDDS